MSRQLRIQFPGALYHVTSRGNERRRIYRAQADREVFLELLGLSIGRYGWLCHSYCLMGNHFHLVVETPRGNLSSGMQYLNGRYAQWFNRRWGRVGHLFAGRYKAILVEREAYLLEVARYVVLNPVRAGWRSDPGEWRWSSYRAMAGVDPKPTWLTGDWLLGQFGPRRLQARERWIRFVADAGAAPAPLPVRADLYLGSDEFIAALGRREPIPDVPREQWQPLRPSLDELFNGTRDAAREAHERWGYTLREIGDHIGRHYSTVSRRLTRARA